MSFLLFLLFLFNKIGKNEVETDSAWKWEGEVVQTMYTHVSKCKNDQKIKAILGERKTSDDIWFIEEIVLDISKLFNMANHLK
jgi:hypothetical protein